MNRCHGWHPCDVAYIQDCHRPGSGDEQCRSECKHQYRNRNYGHQRIDQNASRPPPQCYFPALRLQRIGQPNPAYCRRFRDPITLKLGRSTSSLAACRFIMMSQNHDGRRRTRSLRACSDDHRSSLAAVGLRVVVGRGGARAQATRIHDDARPARYELRIVQINTMVLDHFRGFVDMRPANWH